MRLIPAVAPWARTPVTLFAGAMVGTGVALMIPLDTPATLLTGAAIALIGIVGAVALWRTSAPATDAPAADAPTPAGDATGGLLQAVLSSESAGRKLGAQVGETLASTASIASQTVSATDRVKNLSDEVSTGAASLEEIFRAVESLAVRIQQQEDLVAQSAAAIEEMSASIAGVASIAAARKTASEELRTATERGSRTVGTTERAMQDVSESVAAVNGMIAVIEDIAARTNLLAINAAIEAAHAGNSGRGFAVVAGEVRKLAENASTNAAQISERLAALIGRMKEARTASSQTDLAFREIRAGVAEVTDAFAEITASTSELSVGTQEIVSVTESLRDISAEISGSAVEMRVGAGDVTTAISNTRDAAAQTVDAMRVISAASKTVTESINRITTLSIDSNDQVLKLVDWVSERAHDEGSTPRETKEASQRLRIARIILKHLAWVGRVRSYMDGRTTIDPAELVDHETCDLGVWLRTDGRAAITDKRQLDRLEEIHRGLHHHLRHMVQSEEASEGEFRTLLNMSRQIVEILTSYQGGAFVQWSPEYSVQVELFDAHHQRLFALVDSLYRSLRDGTSREALGDLLEELIAYTGYHFGAEERAFEEYAYPDRETQVRQHRDFVKHIEGVRADIAAGKEMVAIEIMEFLRDWLTNHIKGCDTRYGEFLRDKDLSGLSRAPDP